MMPAIIQINWITMINVPSIAEAVRDLARERPDWLPVLDAAIAVAEQAEADDGVFAGAWVVDELVRRGHRPRTFNNLRLLVAYGLIEKHGPTTRGGRRAYYRMPARAEVAEALQAWRQKARRRPLRFVGAGASTQPPRDVARRAGDMQFHPPPWR